jgi:type IV pilus assembly protein PilC
MFGKRVSLKRLSLVTRSLGTSLAAGVPIVKSIDTQARKTSDAALRDVLEKVVDDIKAGSTLTDALESHGEYFPDLFIDMVAVGEQAGALPEVLTSLSNHYENNLRLRKDFLSQITWPLIQLVAAINIIGLLIYVLGWIGESGGLKIDILGFGLLGTSGVLTWYGLWIGGAILLWFAYRLLRTSLSGKKMVHQALLQVPVIGGCLRSFAIARFSWAFHLTQSAGMPIDDSLDASLSATANGAFEAAAPRIIDDIMQGDTLSDALNQSQLFPEEFINIVHVAETSGTVPEQLERLSPQIEEDARRSLRTLTMLAGWLVWMIVAGFIIYVILKIMMWYTGLIQAGAQDPDKLFEMLE